MMQFRNYLVLLSMLVFLFSLTALARDNKRRSVTISDPVVVDGKELPAGDYKVEWQESGPQVQATFLRNGEAVATVPATLKANDNQVTEDAVDTRMDGANTRVLTEIDFGHHKEALVFEQGGAGGQP